MASVLLLTSNPTRTSPVKRGKYVMENLLGTPPPPPPGDVPELPEGGAELVGTLKQRMEQHRSNAACAVCHTRMDAIGFGLENFDAIGAWRERFNGEGFRGRDAPVLDVSGSFPDGREFTTLEEYKAGLMASKDRFARAFSTKLLTYALGRGLTKDDRTVFVHQLLDDHVWRNPGDHSFADLRPYRLAEVAIEHVAVGDRRTAPALAHQLFADRVDFSVDRVGTLHLADQRKGQHAGEAETKYLSPLHEFP